MPDVELFSGPQCAYCEQAKKLMGQKQIPFTEFNVANPVNMEEFQRRLPRAQSIPQIFVDGKHIGNDQDLKELIAAGHFEIE
jgi:glutaredoxin 3